MKTTTSYAEYRRQHNWSENSLAYADENETLDFSWNVVRMFYPYINRYKTPAVASMFLILAATVLNLANPYLIGLAIDSFITNHNLTGLGVMSVVFLLVNMAMWQAQYWQVWTMSWVGQQILYLLSADMFTHLERLSLSFYDHTQIGRVMSRLQSDIDVLESMLSSGILSMFGSIIALAGIVIAMVAMSPWLALLSFTVLPVMFVIATYWQRFAQRSFRRTRASISLVNSTLQENISGMRVIQSLVREDRNRTEFDDLNSYNRDTNLESNRIAALVLPLVEVVAALATALVVVYGGLLVSRGQLQIGILVSFTLYINRFFDPIRDLSQQYTQLQRSGVAAERIYQIMSVPVTITDRLEAIELPQVQGDVRVSQCGFRL